MRNKHYIDRDGNAILVIVQRDGSRHEFKMDRRDLSIAKAYRSWSLKVGKGGHRIAASTGRLEDEPPARWGTGAKFNKGAYVLLHRLIMNTPEDGVVAFLNGDTTDIRKQNLRNGNHAAAIQLRSVRALNNDEWGIKYHPDQPECPYTMFVSRSFPTEQEAKDARQACYELLERIAGRKVLNSRPKISLQAIQNKMDGL